MKISRREWVLMLLTLTVVLGGLTYWLAAPQFGRWREWNREAELLRGQMELNRRIAERREEWESRYERLAEQVPRYASRTVAPELLKTVKNMADRHGVVLVRVEPGRERESGGFFELSINCSWEASLEALTRMLFDLQDQENRFDVRSLNIVPAAGGRLKGGMNIYCAYYKVAEEVP